MAIIATRLAALASRCESRSRIDADRFGEAVLTWGQDTDLPPDRELAFAVLDAEEAFVLAAPQALDTELLAAIDLVRGAWTTHAATPTPANERAVDDARRGLRAIARDLGRSRLRQARHAIHGRTGPI